MPLHNVPGVYVRFFYLSVCSYVCESVCQRKRENVGKEWRLLSDGINCFFDPVISGRRLYEGAGDEAPMAEFQLGCINSNLWSTNGPLSCPLRPRSSRAGPGHLLCVLCMA